MKQFIFLICILWGFTLSAQQNLVENGDFEFCDVNVSPPPAFTYSIRYAPPWTDLMGTCDLWHPDNPHGAMGVPRTGVGSMRLAHLKEFALGRTLPLTAGKTYEVSFSARRDHTCDSYVRTLGLMITDYDPSLSYFNPNEDFRPNAEMEISSSSYTTTTFCFVAEKSGVHYFTFGGGCIPVVEENYDMCYTIDDVTMFEKTDFADMPVAAIDKSVDLYCTTDTVLLDGTASSNENSHLWKIHKVFGDNVYQCEMYNSGWVNGEAGILNLAELFEQIEYAPLWNSCFRAYLYVDNGCQTRDSFDFCYTAPIVNFLHDGTPACEGELVNLSVTGNGGWTYTWSDANGQLASDIGLKTLQVAPEQGNSTYTLTVTTPLGCTVTKTYSFTVHNNDNVAPWMNGINGTGEYTYYVKAGDAVNFTSTLFNDNPNEDISISSDDNIPSNFSVVNPSSSGSTFSFNWQTHYMGTPPGSYTYTITADDKNACSPGIGTFTFKIVVVCYHCPICIDYEDRTPEGTRLPDETRAGQCITAGLTEPVKTGNADVLFQAGQSITLGTFFEAGPGFEAAIDGTTCIDECQSCCEDWTGFTFDEIPDHFFMHFEDTDPTNDFIQITDTYHPFCAFNAMGYEFSILNRWGNPMNYDPSKYVFTVCCPLESPAPENPIPHSTVWWDGYVKSDFGERKRPSEGTYLYLLKLYGCNETYEKQGDITIGGIMSNGIATLDGDLTSSEGITEEERKALNEQIAARQHLEESVELSPNPTTGTVQITGIETAGITYQIFDDKGTLLSRRESAQNGMFSMKEYPAGTYYVWVFANGTYVTKKLIKL